MRIKIQTTERNFNIRMPNWLILNPVSAVFAVRMMNNNNYAALEGESLLMPQPNEGRVTYPTMLKFFRAIKKCRHILDRQPIVSVNSHDGSVVEFWL